MDLTWKFWKNLIFIIVILIIVCIISIAWEVIQPSHSHSDSSLIHEEFSGKGLKDTCSDDPSVVSSRGVLSCEDLRKQMISSREYQLRVPTTGSLKDRSDILDENAIVIVNSNPYIPENYQKECLYHSTCKNLVNPDNRRLYCPPGIEPIRNITSSMVEGCIGGTRSEDMITSIFIQNSIMTRKNGIHCRTSPDTSTQTPCRNLREWIYLPKGLQIYYLHDIFKIYAQKYYKNQYSDLKNLMYERIIKDLIIPVIQNNSEIPINLQQNRHLKNLIENPNQKDIRDNAQKYHFTNLESTVNALYNRFVKIYENLNETERGPINSSRYLILYLFPDNPSSTSSPQKYHYALSYDGNETFGISYSYHALNGLTFTQTIRFVKDSSLAYRFGGNREIYPSQFPVIYL
jgi:hypothetical protein